jgi:ABC-2 type transport system permease protein
MFLHEARMLAKSALIWAASLAAMAALYLSVYPGMASDVGDFKKMLAAYPPSIQSMLGVRVSELGTLLSFYSMIFTFIALCGAIQAMNLGLSVLSRESREKTADFLLVKPVPRSAVVTAKICASAADLLFTNVVFWAASLLLANLVKRADFSVWRLMLVNFTLLFAQLIYFALGLFLSVFFKKLRSVLSLSLGVVFGFYMLGSLLVTKSDDPARLLCPLKYFDASYIIRNGGYEPRYLAVGAVITAVCVAASYLIYSRKDIHAVS